MTGVASWPSRLAVDLGYYGAIRAFPPLAPSFGRAMASGLLAWSPVLRGTVLANARLALGPDATEADVQRVALGMLRHMQQAIVEILLDSNETLDSLASRVRRYSGQEAYHRARERRRGLVVASAHMGAFEPSLALLRKFESRIHVLFHPDPMPSFERARRRLRRTLGVVEHPVTGGVQAWLALQDALRADEVVVLHADRAMPRSSGSPMPFLGCPDAILPTGPARLALACGAPIVPIFCRRGPDGLEVEMTEPIECGEELLRARDVAMHPVQARLVAVMERAIRRDPSQWLAFAPVRGGAR